MNRSLQISKENKFVKPSNWIDCNDNQLKMETKNNYRTFDEAKKSSQLKYKSSSYKNDQLNKTINSKETIDFNN